MKNGGLASFPIVKAGRPHLPSVFISHLSSLDGTANSFFPVSYRPGSGQLADRHQLEPRAFTSSGMIVSLASPVASYRSCIRMMSPSFTFSKHCLDRLGRVPGLPVQRINTPENRRHGNRSLQCSCLPRSLRRRRDASAPERAAGIRKPPGLSAPADLPAPPVPPLS